MFPGTFPSDMVQRSISFTVFRRLRFTSELENYCQGRILVPFDRPFNAFMFCDLVFICTCRPSTQKLCLLVLVESKLRSQLVQPHALALV